MKSVKDEVNRRLWNQMRREISDKIRYKASCLVFSEVWDKVQDQIWEKIRGELYDQIWIQSKRKFRDGIS